MTTTVGFEVNSDNVQQDIQQHTITSGNNKSTEDKAAVDIWSQTTHSYLYDPNASNIEKIIGWLTIALQYGIYIIIIFLSLSNNSNEVAVTVDLSDSGQEPNQKCSLIGLSNTDFYCSGNAGSTTGVEVAVFVVLITVFLLPDMVKACRTLRRYPFVSIVLLLQALLAIACSNMLIIFGTSKDSSSLDLILSAVAVIFIHELDEKLFETVDVFSNRGKLIFLVVYIVFLAGVSITPYATAD